MSPFRVPKAVADKIKPHYYEIEGKNRGWRFLGDLWTCIEPVDRTIDQDVLRAMRAFDPGLVPIWRKRLWLPPGAADPIMKTHHGLARHVTVATHSKALFYVEMPAGAGLPPNQLVVLFETVDRVVMHEGGPGGYRPFDGALLREMERDFLRDTHNVSEMLTKKMRAAEEAEERAALKAELEGEYRMKQLAPLMDRLEHSTPSDFNKYMGLMQGRDKARVYSFH